MKFLNFLSLAVIVVCLASCEGKKNDENQNNIDDIETDLIAENTDADDNSASSVDYSSDIQEVEPATEVVNEGKNLSSPIRSDNSLTMDDIFCDQNVGKKIDISYADISDCGERDSQIGDAMVNANYLGGEFLGPRTYMQGRIKNYKGKSGVYCCDGSTCAGPYTDVLLWIYDRNNKTLTAEVTASYSPEDDEEPQF